MENNDGFSALADFAEGYSDTKSSTLDHIAIAELETYDWQPRRTFTTASLQELADSIKSKGLLDPILVWRSPKKDVYLIVGGERRWRAHKLLVEQGEESYSSIECKILSPALSEEDVWEIAVIHNKDREDVNPIDNAYHMQKLIDERGYSQEKLAELYNVSQPKISELLKLNTLPKEIVESYFAMELDTRPASSLLRLVPKLKSKTAKLDFWEQITTKKSTVKEAELLVKKIANKPKTKATVAVPKLKAKPADKILAEAERLTKTIETNLATLKNNKVLRADLLELHKRIGAALKTTAKK